LEGTSRFRPEIAVFLNLSPDHLDRHPRFEAYAQAKARIFANQQAGDWAVVNADDAAVGRLAAGSAARHVTFGAGGPDGSDAFFAGGLAQFRHEGRREVLFREDSVRLP